MVLKRLLAVVFAISAIGGAFAFRNWRDTGGSLTGTGPPVVCDASLAAACREAFDEVRLAAPGATFDQVLAEVDGEPFVWIAADVWFDMVDDERSRRAGVPTFADRADGLAHSPLVLAGPGVRECAPATYMCLAGSDVDADLGIENRLDSSAGLLAYGQLAFTRNQQRSANLRWNETEGAELADAPTQTLLNYQNAAGRYDLVIVSEAAFDTLGPDDVATQASDVPVAITIGAVVVGEGKLPDLGDLTDALIEAGWASGAAPAFEGPSAGGLIGLRNS